MFGKKSGSEIDHKNKSLITDKTPVTGTHSLKPFGKPLSEKQWLSYWKKIKIKVDYQLQLEPLTNVNT